MLTITRIFVIYSRSNASAIRIDYIFNLKEELVKEERSDISNYAIEFRDVSFEYNKNERLDDIEGIKRYNINNINIKLKKGQSLGIIGPTGAGKTTIINLLLRLYDTSLGDIYVDGVNIKAYDKKALREKVGIVLQNDTIFNDTVKNNIKFYRDISDEDLEKAINTSQAYEFINALEDGIDTSIASKGTNISGGQKQRLLIARALATKPEILVLDDSSSALDYKTDSMLRSSIRQNYGSITSIIISQRISSIMNCDYIMMIDSGIVLGYGKHEYLLNTLEEYRQIYMAQMGSEVHHE